MAIEMSDAQRRGVMDFLKEVYTYAAKDPCHKPKAEEWAIQAYAHAKAIVDASVGTPFPKRLAAAVRHRP